MAWQILLCQIPNRHMFASLFEITHLGSWQFHGISVYFNSLHGNFMAISWYLKTFSSQPQRSQRHQDHGRVIRRGLEADAELPAHSGEIRPAAGVRTKAQTDLENSGKFPMDLCDSTTNLGTLGVHGISWD